MKQLTKKTRVQDIFNIEDFYDIRELEIISIDPPNCTDIDDALSLEEIDTGYKIGIHIANVSAFTEKFDLFEKIVNRCTTVYGPHKKINMIPNISINVPLNTIITSSLFPNKISFSDSVP